MDKDLDQYRGYADKIAEELPNFPTPNPFLTKKEFDSIINKLEIEIDDNERWYILGLLEGKGLIRTVWGPTDIKEIYLVMDVECSTCHARPGKAREDNGSPAGIHCDGCWEDIVGFCRQRSW